MEEEAREKRRRGKMKTTIIKPFSYDPDPIQFLILNDFRIEHEVFARDATKEQIAKIKQIMPNNSELYQQLKTVADKQPGPRGREFSYRYLVRAVAGFSEAWN